MRLEDDKINISHEQKFMLKMSEDDIQNGQIKSQNDLDKNNLEQPKGK